MISKLNKHKEKIFRILTLLFAAVGGLLIFLSIDENQLLLFFGVGLFLAALIALFIKRMAYYLLIPFLLFLGAGLFFINSLDFQANAFRVNFITPANHTAALVTSPELLVLDGSIPEDFAVPSLGLAQAEVLSIVFEQQPVLSDQNFILSNFDSQETALKSDWLWTGRPTYLPLPENEASLITETLTSLGSDKSYETFYYLSDEQYFYSNDSFESLIVQSPPDEALMDFEVFVNGQRLVHTRTDQDLHYFAFEETPNQIREIQVVEERQSGFFNLETLQPLFSVVYLIESGPSPIVIESIVLNKFFGSINTFVPFYRWDAQDIEADFSVQNGTLTSNNGLIEIRPTDLTPALDFKGDPSSIVGMGLAKFEPYIFAANIVFVVLSLVLFVGASVFLNRNYQWFQSNFHKLINVIKGLGDLGQKIPSQIALAGVTPFKIVLLIFLVLVWLIMFMAVSANTSLALLVIPALLLSFLLIYYIFREIRIEEK